MLLWCQSLVVGMLGLLHLRFARVSFCNGCGLWMWALDVSPPMAALWRM